ncbi:Vibriobactin utilization protein ViuB [Corynebacterium occultum]|uniref:Vibriobactin utilization protein ViuB n=2 Tax=Corynebacterium occultum TaxID=2675219 RepID=A0A6B8W5A2_9CORY|nr:Vibriobactin utilization protein ViuB [Corynebacterium occultum]
MARRKSRKEAHSFMTTPEKKRKPRTATEATVTAVRRLTPDLVRISFDSPGIKGRELPFTDHYLKLLFVPEEADYSWPYNLAEIKESLPRNLHPVTRTYTFRHVDTAAGTFEVDFVTHGDEGLAGPWAKHAKEGDVIAFLGPGGAWGPEDTYEHFVLVGDESAAPAIARALEELPAGATAAAYIEVADEHSHFEMPEAAGVELTWVHRDGATHGHQLSEVVRGAGIPTQRTAWFVHGVAEMLKEMRRFLFFDNEVAKEDVSISGYWRIGMTEDQWQASKQDFNAEIEAAEEQLAAQH